jgi:signal transduction histidine kinase
LIEQLMNQVHDLSLNLRPPMLDDLGVLPTLLWYFEQYTTQTGVTVSFKHRGLKGRRFPPVETATFRIVQEALTNIARHAGVQETTVWLSVSSDTLWIKVTDQGVGFDLTDLSSRIRHGLVGMQERASSVGGRLEIETGPGRGTQITAALPL